MLNHGVDSSHCLRRSPRFCNNPIAKHLVRERGNKKSKKKSSEAKFKKIKRKSGVGVNLGVEIEAPRSVL